MTVHPSDPPHAEQRATPSARATAHLRLTERQIDALTVAMIVAPGVYVRNRMFDFFSRPGAQRARTRASIVRGVLAQLARADRMTLTNEVRGGETVFVLRYGISAVRLTKIVELSVAELTT